MSMTVEEFAQTLRGHRGMKNALLIGLDAGACLMGHRSPTELLGQVRTGLQAGRTREVRVAWANTAVAMRQKILYESLQARSIDTEALQNLLGLLKGQFFQIVLAIDPCQSLYQILREQGLDIHRVDCASSWIGRFQHVNALARGEFLFIDGADLVINGFVPNHLGMDEGDMTKLKESLMEYTKTWDLTCCWGWCPEQERITSYWWNRGRRPYLLGAYTEHTMLTHGLGDYEVVAENGYVSVPRASTSILRELGRHLWSSAPPLREPEDTSRSASVEAIVRPSRSVRNLLWSQERIESILQTAHSAPVTIVEADGAIVRRRLSSALRELLEGQRSQYVYQEVASFASIAAAVSSLQASEPEYIVAELENDPTAIVLQEDAGHSIVGWYYKKPVAVRPRLIVFAAPGAFDSLRQEGGHPAHVKSHALLASDCLNVNGMSAWLWSVLESGKSSLAGDLDEIEPLADRMLSSLRGTLARPDDQCVNDIHLAMDLFRLRLEGGWLDEENP